MNDLLNAQSIWPGLARVGLHYFVVVPKIVIFWVMGGEAYRREKLHNWGVQVLDLIHAHVLPLMAFLLNRSVMGIFKNVDQWGTHCFFFCKQNFPVFNKSTRNISQLTCWKQKKGAIFHLFPLRWWRFRAKRLKNTGGDFGVRLERFTEKFPTRTHGYYKIISLYN